MESRDPVVDLDEKRYYLFDGKFITYPCFGCSIMAMPPAAAQKKPIHSEHCILSGHPAGYGTAAHGCRVCKKESVHFLRREAVKLDVPEYKKREVQKNTTKEDEDETSTTIIPNEAFSELSLVAGAQVDLSEK